MFTKFLTLVLALSIFSAQASASAQEGLKAAFDELNYSLTVEDSSDKAAREEVMKKFSTKLVELQAAGLTNADVLTFAKTQIKNEKVAKDLETALTMIQLNKMNPTEANSYMLEALKNSQMKGASFNGEVFLYVGVGLLFIGLAVAAANGNVTVSGGYNYGYCSSNCYYDYYGYYTCYSGYSYCYY